MLDPSPTPVASQVVGLEPPRPDYGPPPLQFRLKSLLVLTTLLCGVFAVAAKVNGVLLAAMVWILLLAAAHMAASALGTRAVNHAPSRRFATDDLQPTAEPYDPRSACAPTTRLGNNHQLGLSLWVATVAGSAVGCVVGTTLVVLHHGGRPAWPALLLAAVSSAGIGAFLSFLLGSCANVTSRAWREASRPLKSRR